MRRRVLRLTALALGFAPLAILGIRAATRGLGVNPIETLTHVTGDWTLRFLLLTLAAIVGWVTFYAPEGTLQRVLPFIPASVNEAAGRLLFGLGAATCVGLAVWALRRLLR